MQSTDIQSVYNDLASKRAIPVSFAGLVAEKSGINETSVRACLNGNFRVYVSEEAKKQIIQASIQILSEKAQDIQEAIYKLQGLAVEPAV